MKEFEYTITDELGIHARPAGLLVKKAAEFASTVSLSLIHISCRLSLELQLRQLSSY